MMIQNILFVTRFEDGTVTLNMSDQLIDEVIAEALKHINRKSHIKRSDKTYT